MKGWQHEERKGKTFPHSRPLSRGERGAHHYRGKRMVFLPSPTGRRAGDEGKRGWEHAGGGGVTIAEQLPIGWSKGLLGELLPISYGKALRSDMRVESGEVSVFGSNGVVGQHDSALTKGPSIIVGRKGGAGLVHFSSKPCWVIDTAYYTEVDVALDLKLGVYWLRSLRLEAFDRSTAIPILSRDDYSAIEIPFPPKKEQSRIVSKIDELFSDLDAGVAALERARANLKRYRAAVLKAAVEGRLTAAWRKAHPAAEPAGKLLARILAERRKKWEATQLARFAAQGKAPPKGWKDKYFEPAKPDTTNLPELPEGWCWASLSQVGFLDRGKSKHRPRNADFLFGGPYPFIQTGEIGKADTFIRSYRQTYSEAGLAQSRLWPSGTLCITIAANIAETAILTFESCFPDSIVGLLPAGELVSVRYVELYLRTMQAKLESLAPATAQKNINLDTLQQIAICLPPIAEQEKLVEEIDQRLSVAAKVVAEVKSGFLRSGRLRQSILKRAFEGKLVPQDPNDEPASVLLARIRAAWAKQAAAPNLAGRRGRSIIKKYNKNK